MNDLDSLKKRASKVKSILDQKIGVRQTHLNNLEAETKIFDENTYNKQLNSASIDLLNLASFQRRKNTVQHLETLIDAFSKAVYGQEYTFFFKVYDTSFTKLEPMMRKPASNGDFMEVDLKSGDKIRLYVFRCRDRRAIPQRERCRRSKPRILQDIFFSFMTGLTI